ncbi:MAG: PAS domain S-box protein [bacterium]
MEKQKHLFKNLNLSPEQIIKSLPDPWIIINKDKVVFTNTAAQELFQENLNGKKFSEYLDPPSQCLYRDRVLSERKYVNGGLDLRLKKIPSGGFNICLRSYFYKCNFQNEDCYAVNFVDISDIDQQLQHQQFLRDLYESTINSLEEIFHVIDKDYQILMVNKSFYSWIENFNLDIIEPVGKTVFQIFPFLPDKVKQEYQQVMDTKKMLVTEEENDLPGKKVFTETRKIPIIRHDQVIRIVTVIKDITNRKIIEQQLSKSEERLRLALEGAQEGIWDIDFIRNITYTNPKWLEMLGYDPQKINYSLNFWKKMIHPEDRERVMDLFDRHLQGFLPFYEAVYRIQNAGGNYIWVLDHGKVVDRDLHGKPVRAIGTKLDITDRKQLEEKLKKSEEKFRKMADVMDPAFWMVSEDWSQIVYVSSSFEDIYGYSIDELLTDQKLWIDCIYPEDKQRVIEYFKIHHGKSFEVEYRIVTKTKNVKWIKTRTFPILNNNGTINMLTGITEDIDDRKKLEQRLIRAEKMESLGILAGGVAHDLNNILLPMVGYPDVLLKNLPPDSRLRKPLEMIKESGKMAAETVQDLLTLARRGVTKEVPLNINSLVEDLINSSEVTQLKKNRPEVEIDVSLFPRLRLIKGSKNHIYKSLFNLILNAYEAINGPGRIKIEISLINVDKNQVDFKHFKNGDYVRIDISDNGLGIPSEDVKRIFEPFYTKKSMGRSGSGLGLAVVWGTVKDHHGYVEVNSKPQQGSTFTLFFPTTSDKKTDKKEKKDFSYIGSGEKILVVDDVEQQRVMSELMLSSLGYKVSTVKNGTEAINSVKQEKFDLIILDMIMEPDLDGLDTYKKIIEINPGQKALIVSGYSETERVRKAQKLGVGPYLQKPYSVHELSRLIREELDK